MMDCIGGDNFPFLFAEDLNKSHINISYDMNVSYPLISAISNSSNEATKLSGTRKFVGSFLVPIICMFGMIGNLMTLIVLTRKRIKSSCDGTERTVHIGLIALALSDFLICLCVMPYGLIRGGNTQFGYDSKGFKLIYRTYSSALIKPFILTSTWLTVNMATSRYIAIVHPFRARHLVGMRGTIVSILVVVLGCFLLNIPHFFEYQIEVVPCVDGSHIYFKKRGYLHSLPKLRYIYIWVYFTFSICIPQTALAFCNMCLVKALWNSSKLRKRYRVPTAHVDSNYRITSILVTIVVMHILLVSPAEIITFYRQRLAESGSDTWESLAIAEEITNVLQTINFSCNFILYVILNVHFRKALSDIFCMCVRRAPTINMPKFKRIQRATSDLSKQGEATTSHTFVLESKDIHNQMKCPNNKEKHRKFTL